MIRAIRSLSCSRFLQIRSILNGPAIPANRKFRSIESFATYQTNAPTNYLDRSLQLKSTFEVDLLPILNAPRHWTNSTTNKTDDSRSQADKNVLQKRHIKEAFTMKCSQNSSAAGVSISAKSDSIRPESCPPCEPCPKQISDPPTPTASKKPSKGGRLVGGLFSLAAKIILATGVVLFSDAIGVWENPTSWELMQIKWNQLVSDVEEAVSDKNSFGYINCEK